VKGDHLRCPFSSLHEISDFLTIGARAAGRPRAGGGDYHDLVVEFLLCMACAEFGVALPQVEHALERFTRFTPVHRGSHAGEFAGQCRLRGLSLRDQACGCAALPVEQGPKSSTTLGE
jgi:hypothetical protein